jgi:hypothetical protein
METPSRAPEQRTAWNVRDSHATLIVSNAPDVSVSRGTAFTRICAELVFMRPCHVVDLNAPGLVPDVRGWIERVMRSSVGDPLVLNVAGLRESEAPGIYVATVELLTVLMESFASG